jgi:branched-chain amino acid transport system ATP-binding protein
MASEMSPAKKKPAARKPAARPKASARAKAPARPKTPTKPLLEAKGVTKRFGGVVALDGLDIAVGEGEIIGLIGPNGSGKTTFFNVVTGIYNADGGRIGFGGEDITAYDPPAIYRAGIARTFQRSRLSLPLSIFDNIMIGNHARLNQGLWFNLMNRGGFKQEFEENFERARALVRVFDPPLADRMFDAVAGLPMIDRRRIEICRGLISEPRLLMLDEPSAGMTHDETVQLMDDLMEVRGEMENLSVIIVEHEMGVIERITERCVVLNFGRKIAEGTFKEISSDPEVQEAYLGIE